MLTNRRTAPQQAVTPQAGVPLAGRLLTIIDQSLAITGDLQSSGELHVKGRVRGNIHCQSIIVEEEGAIEGGILADHVLIHGRTKGFIRATHIELGPTAIVESDLNHATLIVRDGAMFEGLSETNKSQKHSEMRTDMQVDELRAVAAQMKAAPGNTQETRAPMAQQAPMAKRA